MTSLLPGAARCLPVWSPKKKHAAAPPGARAPLPDLQLLSPASTSWTHRTLVRRRWPQWFAAFFIFIFPAQRPWSVARLAVREAAAVNRACSHSPTKGATHAHLRCAARQQRPAAGPSGLRLPDSGPAETSTDVGDVLNSLSRHFATLGTAVVSLPWSHGGKWRRPGWHTWMTQPSTSQARETSPSRWTKCVGRPPTHGPPNRSVRKQLPVGQ